MNLQANPSSSLLLLSVSHISFSSEKLSNLPQAITQPRAVKSQDTDGGPRSESVSTSTTVLGSPLWRIQAAAPWRMSVRATPNPIGKGLAHRKVQRILIK